VLDCREGEACMRKLSESLEEW